MEREMKEEERRREEADRASRSSARGSGETTRADRHAGAPLDPAHEALVSSGSVVGGGASLGRSPKPRPGRGVGAAPAVPTRRLVASRRRGEGGRRTPRRVGL